MYKLIARRVFSLLGIVLLVALVHAQDATVHLPLPYNTGIPLNFVRTWDVKAPVTDQVSLLSRPLKDAIQTTQYLDGLGRPLQTIVKEGSLITGGSAKDIVSPVDYDEFGRETRKYLPFASLENTGLFKTNPFQQQQNFYGDNVSGPIKNQGEFYYYGKTEFESSPLNRPERTYAPGNSWVHDDKGTKMKYWGNTETDAVRIWSVTDVYNGFGTYANTNNAIYPAGELYKNVTIDEHSKQVIEFKDKEGKVVLKKVQLTATADDGNGSGHGGWLCTYYIYDDLGNLRCVVQPKGVELISSNWLLNNADILAEQCFMYEYDERKRMVRKKVPGAGEVWMVYDARDRLVMTQDANMRAEGKWQYTLYDELNRPTHGGYTNESHDLAYHTNLVNTSSPYPNLAAWGSLMLWQTMYDNYSGIVPYSLPFTQNRSTNFDGYFDLPANWYPEPLTQGFSTRGLVTATRVLNMTAGVYLWTVNYYDEKGRIIQTQSTNQTGGVDVLTTQYNFSGQVLQTVLRHEKSGNNPQTLLTITRMSYDDLGRLTQIQKKVRHSLVNGYDLPGDWTILVQNEYDALGQLKKKKIAPGYNNGAGLETIENDYNIRGWLLGVNRSYINSGTGNKFAFELGYEKSQTTVSGSSYNSPQHNGNISGTIWKSAGDQQIRKYDFTYDAVNRLTDADFNQFTGGSFNKNAQLNFSLENLSYDGNGNIKTMKQWGFKGTSSTVIDDLTYDYNNTASNKLLAVSESPTINTTDHKVGDFTDKNRNVNDYDYDVNGNMVEDKNKGIASITYPHFNLPETITIPGKGTINYRYDGSGNKVKKWTTDTSIPGKTITTTTLYMGGMVYETRTTSPTPDPNDYTEKLLFIAHEEGRIRFEKATAWTCPAKPNRLIYDYFIKDHLGNVRMVLTEQNDIICYPAATVEDATVNQEKEFFRIEDPRIVTNATGVSGFGSKTYKTLGNVTGQKTGLEMVLKVMSGDQVRIFGESFYDASGGVGAPVNFVLGDLLNAFANGGLAAAKGISVTSDVTSIPLNTSQLNSLLNYNPGTSTAKAAINWILFDDQFRYVAGDYDPVGGGGHKQHNKFINAPVNVTTNGYLYIYVSNESDLPVFFDNLNVTHTNGPIMEETHYYPFGLTMAGISSMAMGKVENKKKFNGIEQTTDLDLNHYDAFYRNLDPQIGRWWQIDPKPNEMFSPYAAMANNPILLSDPMGDTTWVYGRRGQLLGVVNDGLQNQAHFLNSNSKKAFNAKGLDAKGADALGNAIRSASVAFIGSNTLSDMRSIEAASTKAGLEVAFVGQVGSDKEIRLTAMPIDGSNFEDGVNIGDQLDKNYSKEQQAGLFLVGHVHHGKLEPGLTVGKGTPMEQHRGRFGVPTNPDDYAPALYRSATAAQRGQSPALILSRYGTTVYGTGSHVINVSATQNTIADKVYPQNDSYILYKSLKR